MIRGSPTVSVLRNRRISDASTGLVDVGARKYDPTVGRFLSADPVFQPNTPQALAGYAYALNNAVGTSDPTGLRAEDDDGNTVPFNWQYQAPKGGMGRPPREPGVFSLPKATRLLDRRSLLAEIRGPGTDYLPGMSGQARLEAVLLVDDAEPDVVEALPADVEEYSPEDDFIAWIRRRLGARSL